MKTRKALKTGMLALLLIAVVYLGVQLYAIFHHPYKTQTAILANLTDPLQCEGIFSAEYTTLTYDGGVLSCTVKDGERVSANTQVANVFNSANEAQSYAYALTLNDELSLLALAQNATAAATDLRLLESQINTALLDYENTLASGDYAAIAEKKQQLQYYYNKLRIGTQEETDISATVASVTATRDAAAAAGTAVSAVYTQEGGYFLSAAGGKAPLVYTQGELDAMALPDLQAAMQAGATAEGNVAGYVLRGTTWRYYIVTTPALAQRFQQANAIYLSFTGSELQAVPMQVVSIEEDAESDLAKIVLSSDYFNSSIFNSNTKKATVYFAPSASTVYYTGLRVDKSALRIIDGVYGVYINYANTVRFRSIRILFENDDYILVPDTPESGVSELKMYDEVIVEGTNLYDGKSLA